MRIFLLTSVYPSSQAPTGTTPVVHYFAKEWVAAGHDVHVFHTESVFPKLYYLLGRLFNKFLYSKLGFAIPVQAPKESNEIQDCVSVTHVHLKKMKPHGRFPKKQIRKAMDVISSFIEKEGAPDCFVGHWDNPQLELLKLLKTKYRRSTCLVYHNNFFSQLYKCYGRDTDSLVNDVDLVGFRNSSSQAAYEKLFGKPRHSFIAVSGVSKMFIEVGKSFEKDIQEVSRFVYVGALIHRKYPVTVVDALHRSYRQDPFEITYIGEGDEKKQVQQHFHDLDCRGKLTFTGRIPRDEVIHYLKQADVFVMISQGELFGLVYLEAMALGCITIAARHQGIDGIIEDGVNGFLCEAGDANELATIISIIRNMSSIERNAISRKAKETAGGYSDVDVAKNYVAELSKILPLSEKL